MLALVVTPREARVGPRICCVDVLLESSFRLRFTRQKQARCGTCSRSQSQFVHPNPAISRLKLDLPGLARRLLLPSGRSANLAMAARQPK